MINQLKRIFPSLIIYESNFSTLPENYKWYKTEDEKIIGIHNKEITDKDEALLSTFLSPFSFKFSPLSAREKFWQEILEADNPVTENIGTYRFIHFSFHQNNVDPLLFKEAIYTIFSRPLPILWLTSEQGIIIEEQAEPGEEPIVFNEIIDVLISDLYVKIRFEVGPFMNSLTNVKHIYTSLVKSAPTIFAYTDKLVIFYEEAIPILFINQVDEVFLNETKQFLLRDVLEDKELIHTIETFFACNLNISVTAKKLYMHRNSLQYRIDKFIEKTGVDIRQFHQAATVYLALISKK